MRSIGVKTPSGRHDPAERMSIFEQNDAAVRYFGINPASDARKKLLVRLVIDRRERTVCVSMAVDFHHAPAFPVCLLEQCRQ